MSSVNFLKLIIIFCSLTATTFGCFALDNNYSHKPDENKYSERLIEKHGSHAKPIFVDTFSVPNWRFPEGQLDWTVVDGVLQRGYTPMEEGDGHYIAYIDSRDLKEYTVSVQARAIQSYTFGGWPALLFGIKSPGDYYAFQFEPATNIISIEQRTDFNASIVSQFQSPVQLTEGRWYTLRIEVCKGSVSFFFDNIKVFNTNSIHPTSDVGLASWHIVSQFDNFVITKH